MRRTAQRGFTLLELAVVVCVVAVLVTLALERLLRYAEVAERSAMEQSVAAMRSALSLRFAALYLKERPEALGRLAEENPMDWLAERPPGYVGALRDPPLGELERPAWYFDTGRKQIVYVPLRTRYLQPGPDGDPRIPFRVVVEFRATPELGGLLQLHRLGIDPARPFHWDPMLP